MKVQLLYDRVFIKPDESETKTKGGIIIPDTNQKDKMGIGTILEVGSGIPYDSEPTEKETEIKKGDRVLFGRYAGSELEIGDSTILVMSEKDIIGIITEDDKNEKP